MYFLIIIIIEQFDISEQWVFHFQRECFDYYKEKCQKYKSLILLVIFTVYGIQQVALL